MKFGVAVTTSVTPAVTELDQKDYVERVSSVAESNGFDSIWVSDRTVYPADLSNRYPDQFGPGKNDPNTQNVLEALTTLAYVGGATRSIKLGTSVLVLPFRNPILNTKMISTLDVLSGGRLILGIGSGWMQEEFDAMGSNYNLRGKITDEHLDFFLNSCSNQVFSGSSQDANRIKMRLFPQALQKPHPPIWIGGNSRASLLRTARFGDGWHAIRLTPEELKDQKIELGKLCHRTERDISEIVVSLRATVSIGQPLYDKSGERMPLTGSLDLVQSDLNNYQESGLDYLVVSMAGSSVNKVIESVNLFSSEFLD